MTTLPSPPDYTDRDYASILKRLQQLIGQVFPKWTDFNRANFGNILLEAYAWTGDMLAYYQDQQARETRWGTATQRVSIIALARLIDYTLDSASAATASVDFTIVRSVSPGGKVTFPAETIVLTKEITDPERFQFLAELEIASGATTGSISVEHSQSQEDAFTAKGEADEEFQLSQTPFLDDSEELRFDGDLWTKVDNFLDSSAADKHYVVLVDQFDAATIRTGDGDNGAIPPVGAAAVVTYKTGGGDAGNVEADAITRIEGGPWYDEYGNSVKVSLTNPAAASGGLDRETVAQANVQAPRSIRVPVVAVSRLDFEDLAIQVSGVARALFVTSNEGSVPEGWGYLYVVPASGGVASPALLTAVENFINVDHPPLLTLSWEARTAIYQTINVAAHVYLEEGADASLVATAVRVALQDYFSPLDSDQTPNELIDFGFYYVDADGVPDRKIAYSKIEDEIKAADGVRRMGVTADAEGMTLNTAEDNVLLAVEEFPAAGALTLYNGDTGATIYSGSID